MFGSSFIKIDRDELLYFDWAEETPEAGNEIYAAGFPLGNPEFTLLDGIVTKKKLMETPLGLLLRVHLNITPN